MPTVFQRIVIFCREHDQSIPDYNTKARIGRKISDTYHIPCNNGLKVEPLTYVSSVENSGTYEVLQYPDSFTEVIDSIISDFLLPKKRERVRKPVRQKAFSAKPSNKNPNL